MMAYDIGFTAQISSLPLMAELCISPSLHMVLELYWLMHGHQSACNASSLLSLIEDTAANEVAIFWGHHLFMVKLTVVD